MTEKETVWIDKTTEQQQAARDEDFKKRIIRVGGMLGASAAMGGIAVLNTPDSDTVSDANSNTPAHVEPAAADAVLSGSSIIGGLQQWNRDKPEDTAPSKSGKSR